MSLRINFLLPCSAMNGGSVVTIGKKKDKPVEDIYVPLTHLERWIPIAFAVLYIGLGAYALFAPVDRKPESTPNATVGLYEA